MRSVIPGALGRNCPVCGVDAVLVVPVVDVREVAEWEDFGLGEVSVWVFPSVSSVLLREEDCGCEMAGVLRVSGFGTFGKPLAGVPF